MKTKVEFRSSKFPRYEDEEALINPGLWGRRLAEYLVEMPMLKRILGVVVFSALALSARAEERGAFTLDKGVAIMEKAAIPATGKESVTLHKSNSGYEVIIHAFMPCGGEFANPWLTLGRKSTLVLEKEQSFIGFHNREECKFKLRVAISRDGLEKGGILYVVNDQVVVGHAVVP